MEVGYQPAEWNNLSCSYWEGWWHFKIIWSFSWLRSEVATFHISLHNFRNIVKSICFRILNFSNQRQVVEKQQIKHPCLSLFFFKHSVLFVTEFKMLHHSMASSNIHHFAFISFGYFFFFSLSVMNNNGFHFPHWVPPL